MNLQKIIMREKGILEADDADGVSEIKIEENNYEHEKHHLEI